MRNTLVVLCGIVVFAIVMALIRYSVAPQVMQFGWIGVLAFIAGCWWLANWMEKKDKEKSSQERQLTPEELAWIRKIHDDLQKPGRTKEEIIDAEFTEVKSSTKSK